MTKCSFGFHNFNKWEIHKEEDWTSTYIPTGEVAKMQKITQKRTCKDCGKTFYESENILVGYK